MTKDETENLLLLLFKVHDYIKTVCKSRVDETGLDLLTALDKWEKFFMKELKG